MTQSLSNAEKKPDLSRSVSLNNNSVVGTEIRTNTVVYPRKTILRGRYNYGVNLGSLFVLEKYIYDDLFTKGGNTEFEAVSNELAASNIENVSELLKNHYQDYINKIDWNWLKNTANVTALRIPVGYWHVNNGQFLSGLPFEPLAGVYGKAQPWNYLKNLIAKANSFNLGVIIDLHAVPGGANTGDHSGFPNATATFFSNSGYQDAIINKVLPFIVSDAASPNDNVIGVEVVNEPEFDSDGKKEKDYYSRALKAIQGIDSSVTVLIPDGWWPQQFADWLKSINRQSNCVIDSHIYRCFDAKDKQKDAQTLINELPSTASLPKDTADFVVGEYSCVLDTQTWQKTSGDRNTLVKSFGQAQTNVFKQNSSFGFFFWTLQFQHGDGGEWGFVPMTNENAIPRRPTGSFTVDEGKINNLINQHANYWKDKGGDKMEHWRYEDALRQTIADIQQYAQFDNSRIGRWLSWKFYKRAIYITEKGDSQFMWEWDQGFDDAIEKFNAY